MDRPDLIGVLPGSVELTIYRSGDGAWVDGVRVEGVDASFDIMGNLQPATVSNMGAAPEGLRHKTKWVIYTRQWMRAPESDQRPDQLAIHGERFRVCGVEDWTQVASTHARMAHYKYYLEEVTDVGAGGGS